MSETERESDFAPAWRPDQGDAKVVKGRVVSVAMSPDFGWGPYPIVTIDQGGSELAIHAQATVLRKELALRHPSSGDEIEVTYLGKRTPKSGGNEYAAFRVRGGKEPEFNWDNELPPEERQQSAAPPIAPSEPVAPPASFQPEPAATGEQFGDKPPF